MSFPGTTTFHPVEVARGVMASPRVFYLHKDLTLVLYYKAHWWEDRVTLKVVDLLKTARKALGPLPDSFLTRFHTCLKERDIRREHVQEVRAIYGKPGIMEIRLLEGETSTMVLIRVLRINKDCEVVSSSQTTLTKPGHEWKKSTSGGG